MEVRNCNSCGRIYNYIGGMPVCPICRNELEEKFQQVKKYIREHPYAQIYDVSEENGVSINQIKQWIREERLTFSKESDVGIDCENCGTMIKTGKYCNSCKVEMVNTFTSAYNTNTIQEDGTKKDTKTRMRYFNQDKLKKY
ncbi:flagellar operon protein (TIGR03826 family) [Natranaerovirga hydrolytica]|uniref:Flagellar operon protein (TIGR03826 family) n=1 Tax=Natranaerovirga hydrolytica TaxID=680378 RepID=A0A4R1MLH0_9FIRM|nr:flagellar protein [Natranaerovirga hydrolytica]TCK93375.1 flagellar operon protein (TIGR03826 family) [Natranaerovirga hydrolytica]